MYIITEEMEIINTELFISSEIDEPAESLSDQVETKPAIVVPITTPVKPAPAVAAMVIRMEANQTAIQEALGSLNLLLLSATSIDVINQVKAIATALITNSGLSAEVKNSSMHMLSALVAEPSKAVFPYKRKYETVGEILFYLTSTSTRNEVASLYYVNAEKIESTPSLSKAFLDRKANFYQYQTAA